MKRFAGGADPIDLLEEREAISTLLPQTTVDNLSKNYGAYTIDPKTRYAALNEITPLGDVTHLYDTDDQTAIRSRASTRDKKTAQGTTPHSFQNSWEKLSCAVMSCVEREGEGWVAM